MDLRAGYGERKNLSAFLLFIFYNFYSFSGPCNNFIKRDCCLKTIYEVLNKCGHGFFFFSESLNFHGMLYSPVSYSMGFYDYTSRPALSYFILCLQMNKCLKQISLFSYS